MECFNLYEKMRSLKSTLKIFQQILSNSYTMAMSDLPDIHVQARGLQAQGHGHIRISEQISKWPLYN